MSYSAIGEVKWLASRSRLLLHAFTEVQGTLTFSESRGSHRRAVNQFATLPLRPVLATIVLSLALAAGEYQLQLLDALGDVVTQVSFQPSPGTSQFAPPLGTFLIAVPADPAIRQAVVRHNGVAVITRTASAHAPTIQMVFPNGGENIADDPVVLSWDAADADGDLLTYVVQYSADGGATFETLAVDWPDKTFSLSHGFFKGSKNALIRVTASDGFNTATDESDAVFTVGNNRPEVFIIPPSEGEMFFGNSPIFFKAFAFDREDGELSGASLQWNSNLDGPLGSGKEIDFQADQLSESTHLVRVLATDGNGLTSTASVQIVVQSATPATLADLFVTKEVTPGIFVVGSDLTYTVRVENRGPSTATGVMLTDQLPPNAYGATYTSIQLTGLLPDDPNGVITFVPNGTYRDHPLYTDNDTGNYQMYWIDGQWAMDDALGAQFQNQILHGPNTTDPQGGEWTGSDFYDIGNWSWTAWNAATNVGVVSAMASQGSSSISSSNVLCNLGNLPSGSNATATIVLKPVVAGVVTNSVTVTAIETDPVPANNAARVMSTVMSADSQNHPPVAQCKNVTVSADANCVASASIDDGSADPDAGDTITLSQSPPSPYGLGATLVTLTVTDNHGASDQCSASVTVVDNTPPQITCPANVTTNAVSPSGVNVTFAAPVVSDNCSGWSVTSSHASGSLFAIGTTTVTNRVIDAGSNTNTCTFTVKVKSAKEQVNDLIVLVGGLPIQLGTKIVLIFELTEAQVALAKGKTSSACTELKEFIEYATKQSGKKLTVGQATLLIGEATRIRAVLGCSLLLANREIPGFHPAAPRGRSRAAESNRT